MAAALCVVLAWSGTATGHPDPPGPPALLTTVSLEKVVIKSQNRGESASTVFTGDVAFNKAFPADGLDGNAEFEVVAHVVHVNHGVHTANVANDAMTSAWWTPSRQIYEHDDCTPRDVIMVHGALTEIDADGWSALTNNLSGAAGGAVVGFSFGNIPGAVVGFLISQIAGMNGNDQWGSFSGTVPANDEVVFKLSNDEGNAEVTFKGLTDEYIDDRGCTPSDDPPPAGLTPGEKTAAVFGPLNDALVAAGELRPEPGNPAGMTPRQVRSARQTGRALALGLAQTTAGLVVDRARALEGNGTESFLAGQEHLATGDATAALEMFSTAMRQALEAEDAGEPAEQPSPLPFGLVMSPALYAAEVGTSVTLLASVLGAVEQPQLFVSSPTDGIGVEVIPLEDPSQLSGIAVTLDRRLRPGVYPLEVTATDGHNEAVGVVQLRVEPSSQRTCRGLAVTISGTPAGETVRGTTGSDVIAAGAGHDIVRGRGGDDVICGGGGRDRLYGGGGDDRLVGGAGDDEVYGGAGHDRLVGRAGGDRLYGGRGRDRLLGGGGDDRLWGGPANDYLEGGRGRDTCDGGRGRDRIVVGGPTRCERYR